MSTDMKVPRGGAEIVAALEGTPLGKAIMASNLVDCLECQTMAADLGDNPDCKTCAREEPSLRNLYLIAWALAKTLIKGEARNDEGNQEIG